MPLHIIVTLIAALGLAVASSTFAAENASEHLGENIQETPSEKAKIASSFQHLDNEADLIDQSTMLHVNEQQAHEYYSSQEVKTEKDDIGEAQARQLIDQQDVIRTDELTVPVN